jgi:hypothetical protein
VQKRVDWLNSTVLRPFFLLRDSFALITLDCPSPVAVKSRGAIDDVVLYNGERILVERESKVYGENYSGIVKEVNSVNGSLYQRGEYHTGKLNTRTGFLYGITNETTPFPSLELPGVSGIPREQWRTDMFRTYASADSVYAVKVQGQGYHYYEPGQQVLMQGGYPVLNPDEQIRYSEGWTAMYVNINAPPVIESGYAVNELTLDRTRFKLFSSGLPSDYEDPEINRIDMTAFTFRINDRPNIAQPVVPLFGNPGADAGMSFAGRRFFHRRNLQATWSNLTEKPLEGNLSVRARLTMPSYGALPGGLNLLYTDQICTVGINDNG